MTEKVKGYINKKGGCKQLTATQLL